LRKKSTSDKKRRSIILSAAIIVTALSLVACGNLADMGNSSDADSQQTGSSDSINKAERVDTGFVVTGPDSYDSADTPILVGKNEDDKTVTFLNLDIGRRYTLSIDGTTKLYDKYGEAVSLDQIQVGDIVDVTFLKSKKHLTSMQLSANAWKYDSVERYEINRIRQEVTIGSEIYKLSDNTQYLSEGRAI